LGKGTWLFSEFSPMISGTIERKVLWWDSPKLLLSGSSTESKIAHFSVLVTGSEKVSEEQAQRFGQRSSLYSHMQAVHNGHYSPVLINHLPNDKLHAQVAHVQARSAIPSGTTWKLRKVWPLANKIR
jgi:hypothetical protein